MNKKKHCQKRFEVNLRRDLEDYLIKIQIFLTDRGKHQNNTDFPR